MRSSRIRDFGLYIAIGLLIVGLIVAASVFGISQRDFSAWFGGLVSISVSLIYCLTASRVHLRQVSRKFGTVFNTVAPGTELTGTWRRSS